MDAPPPPPPSPGAAPPMPAPVAWTSPGHTHHGETLPYDSIGFLAKAVGLLLIFIGALIIVVTVTPPATCVPPGGSCAVAYTQNALNGLLTGRLLLVLGLAGLMAGAGIRLRFSHPWPAAPSEEELRRLNSARRANSLLLLVSLVLLFLLIITLGNNAISLP